MDRDRLTPTEEYIHQEEGFRSKPYRCTSGALTIGIGYNLDAGMPFDEAVLLMRHRIDKIRRALLERLEWFPKLNEARQAALLSMAYQMGLSGLLGFRRTLATMESGDWEKASLEMLNSKWARQTPERAQRTAYIIRYGKFPLTSSAP